MKNCLTFHIFLSLAFLSVCFLTVSCDDYPGMHQGEIRISFDVLPQDIYRAEQKNHVLDSGALQLSEQLPKERIMNYIHNTDGKKRL